MKGHWQADEVAAHAACCQGTIKDHAKVSQMRWMLPVIVVAMALVACSKNDPVTATDVEKAAQDTIRCFADVAGIQPGDVVFEFDPRTGDVGFALPVVNDEVSQEWDGCHNRLFESRIRSYRELPEVRRLVDARNLDLWKLKISCMERRGHQVPDKSKATPDPEIAEKFHKTAEDEWFQCGIEAGETMRATSHAEK